MAWLAQRGRRWLTTSAFNSIYSVGITPLQALFPVEVLSFEMRAKGMAFSSLAVNLGGLLNQFAWPVALDNIGWKTYIVFTVQDAVQAFIIWWFIPETKGRTVSTPRSRLATRPILVALFRFFSLADLRPRHSSRNSMRFSPPRTL